ncbi:HD domain-containing protein [Clostridium sp.]|uniref:HD domain-containing protein n=1 Tax=Clostridium sp. TaxID=1506 RepID=UPI003D6CB192
MITNIDKIKEIVEKELSCSAHNIDHVMRVHNTCIFLSKYEENVNLDILIPAALLHDIARVIESQNKTGEIDHAVLGGSMAEEILRNLDYEQETINKIKHCITTHRYRSGNSPKSIEAKILFDADKLDVIGSIGLARTFMIAGQFGQSLSKNKLSSDYMPINTSENGRLKDVSKHSPFMEYEFKFKKIPEKLFTQKAKEIGINRLKYMDDFFKKLDLEIEGIE